MIPKKSSENAVPLQTHWQTVASVLRIVLNYRIALCTLKSKIDANKLYYYITENKVCLEKPCFDDSSQKVYSIHSASTKQVRTRCTSTGNAKATLENNWPLTSYWIKPNSLQKTLCFGKIPTEKVFLVVWTKPKLNFRCTAL